MKRSLSSQLGLWIALAVAAVSMLSIATFDDRGPETTEDRIQRLSESFACPECDGQSVSESNAAVAATIRALIRDRVAEGQSDVEIRDELIRGYSSDVLLNPPSQGISALVWILPVVFVVFGVVGWIAAVRRSGEGSRSATEDDRQLVADARSGADEAESSIDDPAIGEPAIEESG